ncbi:MAG: phosphatidate cytidylyltransferase [Bacilli bacterium]
MNNETHEETKHRHLLETNEISTSTGANMITRVVSSIILLVVGLPAVFAGGWYFFVIIGIVALFAIKEMINVPSKEKMPISLYFFVYIIAISMIFWIMIKNNLIYYDINKDISQNILSTGFSGLSISIILVAISFGVMFLVTIANERFTIKDVCFYFALTILLALGFQSLYYIRYLPNNVMFSSLPYYNDPVFKYCTSALLLVYLFGGTMLNDIGAYFVGVLFGKHKMNPRVSPKKTWEGFAGGIIISFVLSLSIAFISESCGFPLLPGYLDMAHWYYIVLISFAMPLFTNLGDLAFSAIKREYKIKDFGNAIPGHGGVLDRIDSLLFSATGVACLLILILHNWNFSL